MSVLSRYFMGLDLSFIIATSVTAPALMKYLLPIDNNPSRQTTVHVTACELWPQCSYVRLKLLGQPISSTQVRLVEVELRNGEQQQICLRTSTSKLTTETTPVRVECAFLLATCAQLICCRAFMPQRFTWGDSTPCLPTR